MDRSQKTCTPHRYSRRHRLGALLVLTALTTAPTLPALAQTTENQPVSTSASAPEPGPAAPPAGIATPLPSEDLPPLNLPNLPDTRRGDSAPPTKAEIPTPPPPLPLPKGPAVVRSDIKRSGERYFKLFYSGQWVGWSKFRVTGEMALGETDAVIISSLGEVRVGFGQIVPAQFESRLMLDRKSLRPNYFKCIQAAGGGSFEVECVYSDSMVAQTNRTGDNRTSNFEDFPKGEPPQLVFNNLWGHIDTFPEHYWIMVCSAANGGIVRAYDPILRGGGDVIVYEPKTEDFAFDGRTIKTKVYPISDLKGTLQARVRVVAESMELLEVEEVGRGLKMVRTDASIEKNLSKLKGVDLSKIQIAPSNVVFSDPEQLTALEADVDIHLRGGQLADHRIAGYRQYFTGDLQEGLMKGRVFVRSVPRDIPFDSPYPLEKKHVDPSLLDFLKAGPGAEVEYPPLAIKAREIAWKSPNAFEAAKRLTNFVTDVEEGISLPSARYALESGVGNPESKALLLMAMCRAVGLPSRKITGIAFRNGDFVPHHWVETWLSKDIGWTPFDPTTGEAGRVSAGHIALLNSGEIQDIHVRVTDYAPRGTKKVPYIANELQWSTGEKRTYGVYKDGEKIGTETAEVGDIEVINEEELYRFKASSQLNAPGGLVTTDVETLLNPQALPRRIVLSTQGPTKQESATYEFNEDTVLVRPGKAGEEAFEKDRGREYPFAKGTYFADPHLLTQWALMVGQVPLGLGAENHFPLTIFLPKEKTVKKIGLDVDEAEVIHLKPTLIKPKAPAAGVQKEEAPPTSEPAVPEEANNSAPEVNPTPQPSPSLEALKDSSNTVNADKSSPDSSATPSPESSALITPKKEGTETIAKTLSPQEQLAALVTTDPSAIKAIHLTTDNGMDFWINSSHQIIKIEIPDQGLELILEKVESILK